MSWLTTCVPVALGVLLGAACGSFLGCAAWRVPRKVSLAGRSECPGCGRPVPGWRNLPVVTFVVQRGRAACCAGRLARRYVALEAAGAVAGGLVGAAWGPVAPFVAAIAVMAAAVALSEATRRRAS